MPLAISQEVVDVFSLPLEVADVMNMIRYVWVALPSGIKAVLMPMMLISLIISLIHVYRG